jgi:hypothetical protein
VNHVAGPADRHFRRTGEGAKNVTGTTTGGAGRPDAKPHVNTDAYERPGNRATPGPPATAILRPVQPIWTPR